jgi:hypothetical protein
MFMIKLKRNVKILLKIDYCKEPKTINYALCFYDLMIMIYLHKFVFMFLIIMMDNDHDIFYIYINLSLCFYISIYFILTQIC